MTPEYIEKISNYEVDVAQLVNEFKTVDSMLHERKRPESPVLIQKALTLVLNKQDQSTLKALPYTTKVSTYLRNIYDFNTVTYRLVMPDTCYRWHTDFSEVCLHIPLITNSGCHFVYEGLSFHMPADGSVYMVNNAKLHSFMNAGETPRIHITFENFGTKPVR